MKNMQFNINQAIEILERTPVVLNQLLSGLTEGWTHNNEGGESWSTYDIMGHLIHGELTDWVPRTKIILEANEKVFEPYDRFAQFKNSKGKSLAQLLKEFESLRAQNITTLKALAIDETKLAMEATHPELGKISLKNLLAAWVVHDLGHIAQITRVMAKQYKLEIGVWTEYLPVVQ